jgi:hypothetical protein
VLLDTSFLISFANPQRPHHAAAMQYFRERVRRQVPMVLSTIVISEFQVREAINDLPLRNFAVLPFNVDHAMRCGILMRQWPRDAGDDRVRVKDDLKLIAQCDCEGISHLLTEDASTLVKYLARAQTTAAPGTRAILLKDGFDAAWFDNGQGSLLAD